MPPARSTNLAVGSIAIVAIAGFALYRLVLRPDPPATTTAERARTPEAGSPSATPPVARRPTAEPALPATPPPALPALPNGSAAQTPAEVFSVEPRDPTWAPQIEAEIAERLAKRVPAKLSAECHQSRCKLTLDGASDDVSKTIATLETTKGLIQFADSLYLTKPTQRDDGTMELQAIATFAR